ncbi:hypothetical protein BYT27DRAFT_7097796 [Phlegmacium glaucopus]|nr:hypothetical protein BYT27DRAFT_7097796 [Phlegmacium glaucopus]
MTEVLSATDPLRRGRLTSLDDNNMSYSSNTDWREKYYGVVDMLAETRAELDDFHQASKELEAELENELQRTEKAQQDLQAKVVRAEGERDEWKTKFMSLQTTHNTTTTSLQRELDRLRQEHQQVKIHLRELEMGNDDLERNERAVSSSLADMENKYSRALEEKILLEHELLEKANLEEETQRLKDELRDANVEISILRNQVNTVNINETIISRVPEARTSRTSITSTEDLLNTQPPPDLDLADISPSCENLAPEINTTPKASLSRSALPSTFLRRAGFQDKASPLTALKNSSNIIRSSTIPTLASPSAPSPRGLVRPTVARNPSIMSASSSTGSIAKNKGVQMVSEMRARVRNLEQKIHTRVPRLRMGSITGRPSPGSGVTTPTTGMSSASSAASNSSTAKTSWESQRKSIDSRLSNDSGSEKNTKREIGDTSGWVLIMEDSPSPQKDKEAKRLKEKRRVSNPPGPTAFRPTASTVKRVPSPSLSTGPMNSLAVSTGLRRPQSRLSGGGSSATSSSSRPQTPTFLPVPSSSLHTPAFHGLKKSTGPSAPNSYNTQLKRSSLGKPSISPPPPLPTVHRERPTTMPPVGYTTTLGSSIFNEIKALPTLPDLHSNVTIRASSRIPSSGPSVLSKSRIGRPSKEGISGRRSGGGEVVAALDIKDLQTRSGSPSAR